MSEEQGKQELHPPPTSPQPNRSPALSPQGSRRSQSPTLEKGKLDTVFKLLSKEEAKLEEAQQRVSQLRERRAQLQTQLEEKEQALRSDQENNSSEEETALRAQKEQLEARIKDIRNKRQKMQLQHATQVNHLERQHQRAREELESRSNSESQAVFVFERQLAEAQLAKEKEEARAKTIQEQLRAEQERRDAIKGKILTLRTKKTRLQKQFQLAAQKKALAQQQEEARRQELINQINLVKDSINSKKHEIELKKSQTQDDLKIKENQLRAEIDGKKRRQQELQRTNQQLESEIAKKDRQAAEEKEAEKRKERRVAELKTRSAELQKRLTEMKEKIKQLETEEARREEQKVPEELLQVRARNANLQKEIKKTIERCQAEKAEMDKLVPPAIIQNMNRQISNIISNNEKLVEVTRAIEEIGRENKQLAQEKESLEWDDNIYVKQIQSDRKKQEEKNKILEEEVAQRRKNLTSIQAKLDQYIKAYPEFKPKKRVEPVQPGKKDIKIKATVSIPQDDRSDEGKKKKKKGNKVPQYQEKAEVIQASPPRVETKPSRDRQKKGLKYSTEEQGEYDTVEVPDKAELKASKKKKGLKYAPEEEEEDVVVQVPPAKEDLKASKKKKGLKYIAKDELQQKSEVIDAVSPPLEAKSSTKKKGLKYNKEEVDNQPDVIEGPPSRVDESPRQKKGLKYEAEDGRGKEELIDLTRDEARTQQNKPKKKKR